MEQRGINRDFDPRNKGSRSPRLKTGKTKDMTINGDTRITLFYHNPYRGDGVARMKLILARSLADRGFQVDYVGWRTEGTLASRFPSNVRVVKLYAPNILFRLLGLVRYLKHARPAAILSSEDIANLCTMARNIARVQTRVIAIAHIPYSYEFQNRGGKVRLLGPFLVRKVLSKADTIVAVSQGVADDLSTLTEPESNIVTIHNPIDSNEVQALGSQPLDHPWFAPGQPPVILGVGRLQQAKDFPTLIRAFQVVRQNSNSRLMILGEGSERAGLESLVENLGLQGEVGMPGFKDNPYVYMSRSAVFVLSSVAEGLGRVSIEALALGTPVVSTDCPSGPSEILEGGAFGRLVPVGDADALAVAILETMAEDSGANERRARARDFSIDASVDRYLEVMGIPTLRPPGGADRRVMERQCRTPDQAMQNYARVVLRLGWSGSVLRDRRESVSRLGCSVRLS